MIVYGTRTVKTKKEQTNNITCTGCGKNNTTQIQYYQKYYHIWFIPMIPLSRSGVTVCSSCGYSTDDHTMPTSYIEEYKTKLPTPKIWFFTGLIISIIITIIVYWKKH
jgi:C4-type Zn-finger protein